MKTLLILISALILPYVLYCQYLNMPESIIFDSDNERYLVSNYATGSIVAIDESGNQEVFVQNMNATQGLCIVGSVVYVGCDSTVRGFSLNSGNQVMNLPVYGVSNLNDVTADLDGNLYVSDVFGTKIIKVNTTEQTYSVFVHGSGIYRPNGLTFDSINNRILVCSYRENFPIQAIDLASSTVTLLMNTSLDYSDGICIDGTGNVYFTSWSTNSIYKVNRDFTTSPEAIYTNPGGPADISFDHINNRIAIPLQGANSVDFIDIAPSDSGSDPELNINNIYPNPSHGSFTVTSNIGDNIYVYTLSGELIMSGTCSSAISNFLICTPGYYIVHIISNKYNLVKPLIIH